MQMTGTATQVLPDRIRSEFADESDMRPLVDKFVDGLHEHISVCLDSLVADDLPTLKRRAHQIKGAGGGYGFPLLSDSAEMLESAVEQVDHDGMHQAIQQLAVVVNAIQAGNVDEELAKVEQFVSHRNADNPNSTRANPENLDPLRRTASNHSMGADVKAMTVLVVDDSRDALEIVRHLLEQNHINTLCADCGEQGLQLAKQHRPDMIMLDGDMPDLSGFEVCRRLKDSESVADIPVLFVAGSGKTSDKIQALQLGAIDYVSKPYDPVELQARVQAVLRMKQLQDERVKLNRKLIDSARSAGMAEIATSVLHNVGNALNSVTVSAGVLQDAIRSSHVGRVRDLSNLFNEHADSLGDFLTDDKRGKAIPAYLGKLAQRLTSEFDDLRDELSKMSGSVQHIQAIIAAQQSIAMAEGLTESCPAAKLIDESLEMQSVILGKHDVVLERTGAECGNVHVDRHKVTQIMINLVKNGVEAMLEADTQDLRLFVDTRPCSETHIAIMVSDNGAGIPRELANKVFTHGFTTKKSGHGFGLHACANFAIEMGGSLRLAHTGPGTGATMILELPRNDTRPSLASN